jgi:hypothetical protein
MTDRCLLARHGNLLLAKTPACIAAVVKFATLFRHNFNFMEDKFYDWLVHFSKHTNSAIANPVLLSMDNHLTHTTLKVFDFCKENGIVVVSLPPHTSHRMQPLGVTFYGPLKSAYNQEYGVFLKINSYKQNLQDNLASLFTTAYSRVAAIEKAVKGFQSTGIFPFYKNIFHDEDFSPPNEDASIPGNVTPPQDIHRPSTLGKVN